MRKTGLYDFHLERGAKMVPFAGYSMPLVYGDVGGGQSFTLRSMLSESDLIAASHKYVRESVGLFDVGHMAQHL